MKQEVIDSLKDAYNLVKEFEMLLTKEYNLKDIPFNVAGQEFPRIGKLLDNSKIEISYKFHGSGCRIEKENVILEYGISPITENSVKITPRDLMIFMKSYKKDEKIQKLISRDLHLIFTELKEENILKQRPEAIANYEIIMGNVVN